MLENYITQVKRPKGVSSEREAFVSRAAHASAAACHRYIGRLICSRPNAILLELVKKCLSNYFIDNHNDYQVIAA